MTHLDETARARDIFLSTGASAAGVRRLVAESWRRSRARGVQPDALAAAVAPGPLLAQHPLAAVPVVRRLLVSELASDGMVAVLGDAGGRLLWIEGHHGVRSALEDAGFAEGTVWTEDVVGTSAPGLALALGQEAQVRGAEHFADAVTRWSCTAAPVRDPRTGAVIGLLDITGGPEVAAPHMLSLVRAAVGAVEAALAAAPAPGPGEPDLLLLGRPRGRWRTGVDLSLRHSEILAILADAHAPLGAEELGAALYADDAATVTVRAEVSRLRRALPGVLADGAPYRVREPIGTDAARVRDAVGRGDLAAALARYDGDLLPTSRAPGVEERREDLRDLVRAAVLAGSDARAVARWVERGPGREDWHAWRRLAQLSPTGSADYLRARLRLGSLDSTLS